MKRWILLLLLMITLAHQGFSQDSLEMGFDEFEEFDTTATVTSLGAPATTGECAGECKESAGLKWTGGVLFFTMVAGIMVRYRRTRQLRSLFLVASLVLLGFFREGCPCSIQGLHNAILLGIGVHVKWQSLVLVAGLVPLTYFFGRVYCGWICHLGALQEFIFKTSAFQIFQSQKAQQVMRYVRIIALAGLVIQLVVTQTNLFKLIDPFAVIFSFYSQYPVGWILVAILILSSIAIYRPFCKTLCPIGLMLGWLSKIPGSSVLSVNKNCISCTKCNSGCQIKAITRDGKHSKLDNQECIRCGECFGACRKSAISFSLQGPSHPQITDCKSPSAV